MNTTYLVKHKNNPSGPILKATQLDEDNFLIDYPIRPTSPPQGISQGYYSAQRFHETFEVSTS